MSARLATLLSYLFHPLLLATYLFALLTHLDPLLVLPPGMTVKGRWLVVLIVWLTTFAIPAISLYLLKATGQISSLRLYERQERLLPFFYVALLYGTTAWFFSRQIMVTPAASALFILIAVLIFCAGFITLFWKISVHSLGMGGLCGSLLAIGLAQPENSLFVVLLAVLLISGLVMAARLRLQAHTPAQVYVGFVLGVFISFMLIFWV
ncbi:MAG TPA: hypothetical protein ENJ39_04995 [Flammeovirgaceae bacterium]|nr:hypothetical protein [Flammeovirgaceae bacterium]